MTNKTLKTSAMILASLKTARVTKSDLAIHLKISRQLLHYKIKNESWTIEDLAKVADFLHIDFQIVCIGQKNEDKKEEVYERDL